MASPLGLLSRLSQRLGSRDTTRARKSGADSERTPTPAQLVFETFEPRLLLAADPLGITAGYAFNEVSGTTTADASGHGIIGTLTNGPTFTTGTRSAGARDGEAHGGSARAEPV